MRKETPKREENESEDQEESQPENEKSQAGEQSCIREGVYYGSKGKGTPSRSEDLRKREGQDKARSLQCNKRYPT